MQPVEFFKLKKNRADLTDDQVLGVVHMALEGLKAATVREEEKGITDRITVADCGILAALAATEYTERTGKEFPQAIRLLNDLIPQQPQPQLPAQMVFRSFNTRDVLRMVQEADCFVAGNLVNGKVVVPTFVKPDNFKARPMERFKALSIMHDPVYHNTSPHQKNGRAFSGFVLTRHKKEGMDER